jgi:hypothetical protein
MPAHPRPSGGIRSPRAPGLPSPPKVRLWLSMARERGLERRAECGGEAASRGAEWYGRRLSVPVARSGLRPRRVPPRARRPRSPGGATARPSGEAAIPHRLGIVPRGCVAGLRRLSRARHPGVQSHAAAAGRVACRRVRGGHGRPEVRPPGRPANPWRSPRRPKAVGAMDGLVFAPAHPFGPASAYASLAWMASHRRSRHTLAVPPTCQGCRGHGWAGFRAGASLRACFGLRESRLEGEPSQVEAHLGCASDLPRLSGPWMARQPYVQKLPTLKLT